MKKVLALLLALTLVIMAFPTLATAEDAPLTELKVLAYERNPNPAEAQFGDRDRYIVWQAAEEMFKKAGVTFDFEIIPDVEQYRTTVQTRLASAYDLPDLINLFTLTQVEVLDLADMGTILPINPILESTKGNAYDYFFGGEGDKARSLLTTEDGNFYWMPRIQVNMLDGKNRGTSMGVTIRNDWLKTLGLEVPQSLDAFTDALRAFQENDMNENGIKDEVALLDTSYFSNGINYWFGIVNSQDTVVGINLEEGKVESPWYSPVIREYFEYIQLLTAEGLLFTEAIGATYDSAPLLNANKVSAVYYYPIGTYLEVPIRAAGFEDAYYLGIMPFPAVDGVKPFYSEETPYLVYLQHGVTSTAADKLDAVAAVYDTIYSPEYIELMEWGIEGPMWVYEDGEKVRLTAGKSSPELAAAGESTVDGLYRNFLPNLYHNERLVEMNARAAQGFTEKFEYELATADYPYNTPNDNTGYYAVATPEEAARLSAISTDLNAAARELAANLSLNRISLDDLDAQIETLKAMGLDEVIAIRQAQLDRANGK